MEADTTGKYNKIDVVYKGALIIAAAMALNTIHTLIPDKAVRKNPAVIEYFDAKQTLENLETRLKIIPQWHEEIAYKPSNYGKNLEHVFQPTVSEVNNLELAISLVKGDITKMESSNEIKWYFDNVNKSVKKSLKSILGMVFFGLLSSYAGFKSKNG